MLHEPRRNDQEPRAAHQFSAYLKSLRNCDHPTNRLKECHTVPKGITVLPFVLSYFKLGNIISVHYDNNSKQLINP
jgi:hypothetical protein